MIPFLLKQIELVRSLSRKLKQMIKDITVQELKNKIDNNDDFILIDVRTNHEVSNGKLEKAIHVDMSIIPDKIDEFDPAKEYLLICRAGIRSFQVAHFLQENGFSKISNVRGGMLAWASQIDKNILVL
jgi:rhodanese-related sulfurtransferase